MALKWLSWFSGRPPRDFSLKWWLQDLGSSLGVHVEVIEMDAHAEDPHFVEHAVKTLIAMIEAR